MFEKLWKFWFTFASPVSPRQYLTHGGALMLSKYLADVLLVWIGHKTLWTPLDYMHSFTTLQSTTLSGAPQWLMPTLAFLTLPFLWAGISLTVRRAIDAGHSPWFALGFFVPYLNYATIAMFCVLPSQTEVVTAERRIPKAHEQPRYLMAMFPGIVFGLAMLALAVYQLNSYGVALFFATPFGVGAITAFALNRQMIVPVKETSRVVALTMAILSGILILFGREGVLCLAMALPLAIAVGMMGSIIGRQIAMQSPQSARTAGLSMLMFPAAALLEPKNATGITLHEVRTSIEIAAAPMVVWSQVIAFPPMPEPTTWFFKLGIAYPKYARIEGSGVGAVRYCVFSTGPFVEPITIWEPGKRLSFDVRSSPAPLRELSMYDSVAPPHLKGFLESRRGEFRLIALPNGGTRLEGSTWYSLKMGPEGYWQLFGDYLIHRIHLRVLDHIRVESERLKAASVGT